ncbi:MAG TPA: hypothetical protein VNM22_19150 [Candidatus Limnocylindrales bacterium]|nr:hypothetical protein [Candidatus Limnocylindrales bacterium]
MIVREYNGNVHNQRIGEAEKGIIVKAEIIHFEDLTVPRIAHSVGILRAPDGNEVKRIEVLSFTGRDRVQRERKIREWMKEHTNLEPIVMDGLNPALTGKK